jgi:ADP-ribosylglycohydrolase
MKEFRSSPVIGAIAGDIIGSAYEFNNVRRTDFDLFTTKSDFTDDTVLTIAVADCILNRKDFARTIWEYGRKYPNRGYGKRFFNWLLSYQPQPYNSLGNGSAMRVSPAGAACKTMDDVLSVAKQSAEVTHDHPEGIRGAQAVASAIFLARDGKNKESIKNFIQVTFGYDLSGNTDDIRKVNVFDETCPVTVPQAMIAFFESTDYEHAIRLAVSIGGDSDTIACMTGGIAAAYYKTIPQFILTKVFEILPPEFVQVIEAFDASFV